MIAVIYGRNSTEQTCRRRKEEANDDGPRVLFALSGRTLDL
jgi:hypothetical protein